MQSSKVFLASSSPQRRDLMRFLQYPFEALSTNIEEKRQVDEKPESYVCRLAEQKAQQGLHLTHQHAPVLGADTIVVLDQAVLEKPQNQEQACRMLTTLSGKTHQVYTAVALVYPNYCDLRLVTTRVSFCRLTPEEIQAYWATGEPIGKAGAYAIQGIGGKFITRIEGSYSGVVGLPLLETDLLIKAWQAKFHTGCTDGL